MGMKVYTNGELVVVEDGSTIITYDVNEGEAGISLYENNAFVKNYEFEEVPDVFLKLQNKAEEIIMNDEDIDFEDMPPELAKLVEYESID